MAAETCRIRRARLLSLSLSRAPLDSRQEPTQSAAGVATAHTCVCVYVLLCLYSSAGCEKLRERGGGSSRKVRHMGHRYRTDSLGKREVLISMHVDLPEVQCTVM